MTEETTGTPAPAVVTEIEWLVEPVEVPADDMPWTYMAGREERTIYPQKGKIVRILPVRAAGTQLVMPRIVVGQAMAREGSEAGDEAKAQAGMALVTEAAGDVVAQLSAVVVEWDIIGWDSRPLPQPYRNPKVMQDYLPDSALAWLSQAAGAVAGGTWGDDEDAVGKDEQPTVLPSRAQSNQTSRSASRLSASGTTRTRNAGGR